ATGTPRQTISPGGKVSVTEPMQMVQLRAQIDGTSYPMTLTYSDDGRVLARAGEDGVIRVWDARGGQEIGSFTGHPGPVGSLNFAPDGGRLVSGSNDTTALVWDVAPMRDRLTIPAATLEPARLEALWAALNEPDAAKAYPAILALASDPVHSVAFLKKRVKP